MNANRSVSPIERDRHETAAAALAKPMPAVCWAARLMRERPDLKINEIACLVGVSERGFRAAFKRCLGVSPKAFQVEARLEAVKRSVDEGRCEGCSIEQIAELHGYSHAGRLSSAYRRRFGVGITQWRVPGSPITGRNSNAGDPRSGQSTGFDRVSATAHPNS